MFAFLLSYIIYNQYAKEFVQIIRPFLKFYDILQIRVENFSENDNTRRHKIPFRLILL